MSRHTIHLNDVEKLVVGWDPPLETFFANYEAADDDEAQMLLGCMPKELPGTDDLNKAIVKQGFAPLTKSMMTMLDADKQREGRGRDNASPAMQAFLDALLPWPEEEPPINEELTSGSPSMPDEYYDYLP